MEQKNEIQISWLHLSDLHFGLDNYNEKVVIAKLLEDIQEQIRINQVKLDFVFITGDLTASGKEEEFQSAEMFINKLSAECQVDKENIIVIPGNHDVFWNDIPKVATRLCDYIENEESVSQIIGNDSQLEMYTKGLDHYRNFLYRNFQWAHKEKEASFSYVINKKINDISISVLALNTAWLSYGKRNKRGKIILGERQVREALEETGNSQMIIALMHHPFEWLEWFDAQAVQEMLERRTDFILNGHEHRLEVIGKGLRFGKAFKISAGSTYEIRNHLNSYNIVSENITERYATCYLRRFVDENGGSWAPDNIEEGKIKIKLSDRLSEIMAHDSEKIEIAETEYWIPYVDSKISINVPEIPRELVRQIKNGKCILFAGAGTSLDAGLPSWSELLKTMVEKVNEYSSLSNSQRQEINYLLRIQDFTTIAEFCKEKLGKYDFAEIIKGCLNTQNKYSQTHNILSQIPFKAAVTTNYDDFIEKNHYNSKVLLPGGISELSKCDIASYFQQDLFPVFKIHGSYENADSIILTDQDYRNAIFKNLSYRENLKVLFEDKSLLFIGFSFRDPSVNLLLQEIFTVSNGSTRAHYAFMNDVGEIKKDFFWKSMNLRVISYSTIDNSHIALTKLLKKLKYACSERECNDI